MRIESFGVNTRVNSGLAVDFEAALAEGLLAVDADFEAALVGDFILPGLLVLALSVLFRMFLPPLLFVFSLFLGLDWPFPMINLSPKWHQMQLPFGRARRKNAIQ